MGQEIVGEKTYIIDSILEKKLGDIYLGATNVTFVTKGRTQSSYLRTTFQKHKLAHLVHNTTNFFLSLKNTTNFLKYNQ